MSDQDIGFAFVIATKDRPNDLRKMLKSLSDQTRHPDQIIIVDSSKISLRSITSAFKGLNIKYIYHPEPSAAAQRNIGVKSVDSNMALIGFLDDDVILENSAVEAMLRFWKTAPEDLGGCAFNLMNTPQTSWTKLKATTLVSWLGLYSRQKGAVMPSGWQTLSSPVSETIFVDWLPSGASVWRKDIFKKFSFDDFFDRYSYLEDLDFSYSVGKKYKLAVLADAVFYHYPSLSGKGGGYQFGKTEVRNRLYFVKKHKLSSLRCYTGILIRIFMTLGSAIRNREIFHIERIAGNCIGLVQSFSPQNLSGLSPEN
jgi:glycosyltransferase involved in cell wall biosynthesis